MLPTTGPTLAQLCKPSAGQASTSHRPTGYCLNEPPPRASHQELALGIVFGASPSLSCGGRRSAGQAGFPLAGRLQGRLETHPTVSHGVDEWRVGMCSVSFGSEVPSPAGAAAQGPHSGWQMNQISLRRWGMLGFS